MSFLKVAVNDVKAINLGLTSIENVLRAAFNSGAIHTLKEYDIAKMVTYIPQISKYYTAGQWN
jgi:hypothetical protein